ncbi:hypothetical protein SLH49_00700 [Cognatiyoonia sp. IB215446]|uniref:hypothetical protein n=1 Tax=Cognatiyoonia sp. IB215446 TaxID=3097355 RepID=UPI002A0D8697|nr:hypothetical protein [Cognatiyoonia sp. IB215446]MDX8346493.1 hypothetical protein [Cognatiyoonia sp. IB215446]
MKYLIGFLCMISAPVFAQSFDEYGDEYQFGPWRVACETLDDMGGLTYLDCLVEEETTGLILLPAQSQPALALRDAKAGDMVRIGDETLEPANCPRQLCPLDTFPDAQTMVEIQRANAEIVIPDLAELEVAIARARALID